MHFMRIGRLWVNAEYDGAEGWQGQYAWPGGRIRDLTGGIRQLFGANVRKTGTVAGCRNWTGPNGTLYGHWTSGMYRSYDYDYLPYWKDQTHQTALMPVTQVLYQRWPPPEVFVNGVNITPDAGDGFLESHDGNTAIDPNLITERAIKSVWRYTMGVEYVRWIYGYSNPNHQDYVFYDITLTNNGKMYGLPKDPPDLWPNPDNWPQIIEGQQIEDFWWAQTLNPWNSALGRRFSFGADDAVGEFITPFAPTNDRRLYLFYDGDNIGSPEKDWGDPSKDERWVELLSPAWIIIGALYADTSPGNKTDDVTQPKSTTIKHERNFDLGRLPKTMQEQYDALFVEDGHWQLNTPHRDIDPAITRPSGYNSFGPYDMNFGESVNIVLVVAAGGINHDLVREYGKKAWDAGYSGPVMDEIEVLHKTGRDSVLKTLQIADWNCNATKPGGRDRFDVPDAPRPPAQFFVTSEGPRIKISWSDESRNDPDFDTGNQDFAGYRVYKAVGARDSVYRQIYDGQANETFDDDVSEGFQYFYYVVAYDNGDENWENPGVSLESSKYHCWTGWAPEGASPAAAPITSGSKMDDIRVVPNPYSAAGLTYPGEVDKIVFTGLPAKCTITIFTTNGDYVHKLEHTDGSGNEDWDLRTEFNQYIVSDVYIYTVKSDIGDHVGKFIVVR
jgi:hypothetical protein